MAGAALFFIALALPQLGRPLIYDEVDFAKAARAVAGGSFRYDRGYIADYPWNPESGTREQYALYHPPGYVLLLAGWQRLAGQSDAALRVLGMLGGLATLGATAALGRLAGGPAAGAAAALLWVTSPYAIQSALLLDVDGAALAPLTASLAWFALRLTAAPPAPERPRVAGAPPDALAPRRHAFGNWLGTSAMALAFALALWAKLTTPPMVAATLVLWLALTHRPTAAARLLLVCAAGAGVFALTWWLFANSAGLPAAQPFRDLWYETLDSLGALPPQAAAGFAGGATGGSGGLAPLSLRALVAALRAVQWLHPLFVGLLVAAPLALRKREPGAALLAAAAVPAAVYLAKLAAGFPKYHAGILPLACAALAVAVTRWAAGRQSEHRSEARWWRRSAASLLPGLGIGAALTLAAGPDALIRHADLGLLAGWLAAGAGCLALVGWLGGRRLGPLAVGLLLGANTVTAIFQATQAGAGWSTTYFYGTGGQTAAGAWLRQMASGDELVAADREVAYYAAPVHYLDSERLLAHLQGRESLPDRVSLPRLVVTRHAAVAARLPPAARQVAAFGAYRAWIVEHVAIRPDEWGSPSP